MEQAVLLCAGQAISALDLMLPARPASTLASMQSQGHLHGVEPEAEAGSTLDRVERELLIKASAEARHNVSQAARALGISRDTLRYRLEKHGLKL